MPEMKTNKATQPLTSHYSSSTATVCRHCSSALGTLSFSPAASADDDIAPLECYQLLPSQNSLVLKAEVKIRLLNLVALWLINLSSLAEISSSASRITVRYLVTPRMRSGNGLWLLSESAHSPTLRDSEKWQQGARRTLKKNWIFWNSITKDPEEKLNFLEFYHETLSEDPPRTILNIVQEKEQLCYWRGDHSPLFCTIPMEVQAPPCWSNILKQQPQQQEQQQNEAFPSAVQKLVGSCSSIKGIAVAVVDANAKIQGGERLFHSADCLSPSLRSSVKFAIPPPIMPSTVDTLKPSPEALKKVVSFARAMGDLQTLSNVDMKLIALTKSTGLNISETAHLLLKQLMLKGFLKKICLAGKIKLVLRMLPVKMAGRALETCGNGFEKPKRYLTKKREIKVDEKKMVAGGIDASLGQSDENTDDWRNAVIRSTHRRFLRRKARREMSESLSEQQDTLSNLENENLDDDACPELLVDESYEETINGICKDDKISTQEHGDADISEGLNKVKLDEECMMSSQNGEKVNLSSDGNEFSEVEGMDSSFEVPQEDLAEITDQELENLEMTSQASEDVDSLHTNDISSEQSWTLRSLSESSEACITGDSAMQNVLLQMGLRLLAPGGMQIRELHRWVRKCHACSKVTTEIGKIFCPTCGNGGTLRKVVVTVNDNSIVLARNKGSIHFGQQPSCCFFVLLY
ncbi:hypothetical protein C2S51_022037 [Perilla frutescens var. frutescens]|nr:hypothetical protein C2S51_022037 [Perilla frutescens var. frutescens]